MKTHARDAMDSQDVPGSIDCTEVRDVLPLLELGLQGASAVEAHLEACCACREETRFVKHLQGLRPEPPSAVLQGVLDRHRSEGQVRGRSAPHIAWWLLAAAVAALALGVRMFPGFSSTTDDLWTLALDPAPVTWYGEEWMVAGEPVPEALSDDILVALFREMDP
jgi:predicted anti-sigma-YlaC factor YlaD